MAWFTIEDCKIAFNIFCFVYGVGTLGMPANFARSGAYIAVTAMLAMACANAYASVVSVKIMLVAPRSVKNYGDLGEWVAGGWGRAIVLLTQLLVCLLMPCAYLVLGGTLLDDLFPGAFSTTTWICLMALAVTPACLVPLMKEGAGVALVGCLGTLIADVIGIAVLLHGMAGHPTPPAPHLRPKQVLATFGNLGLAYGGGVIIPLLTRQHTQPHRMPRVVCSTVVLISVLFLIIAVLGYSAVGCQISGNLLFTIYPNAETGLSALGFAPNWGSIVIAFMCMQIHCAMAVSVVLSAAFYDIERLVLGMHKQNKGDLEDTSYQATMTPPAIDTDSADVTQQKIRSSNTSFVSLQGVEQDQTKEYEEALKEYEGVNAIRYAILRIVVIVLLVLLSIALKDHFLDLTDFVGASCLTINSVMLPIIFYLKTFWPTVPLYEKVPAILVLVVCFGLGCYVTYTSGQNLFAPVDSSVSFPFCAPEYQNTFYYVRNATSS